MGNVFCSRHAHADMGALENGTLFIRTRKLEETAEHISRLSIRLMLNGDQWYKVGSTDRRVHADNFLVVNQGQRYRTAFSGGEEQEMIMVGFRPGQAEDVFRSMTERDERLLDEPFFNGPAIGFFEQTYPRDAVISEHFGHLRRLMDAHITERAEADLFTIHTALLERLIHLQYGVAGSTRNLSQLQRSTRMEAWRRLNIARDLVEARFQEDLRIPDLARAACMSPHHFKRMFKDAFGVTPHRYLREVRLARAQTMLRTGRSGIQEVAGAVGYSDPSAFVRLYKQVLGRTPGSERNA